MDTHVTFVLDSSGSMSRIENDTVGGFNTFLDDQQDEPGTATVTLYDFNTTVDQVYEGRETEEAPPLGETYSPSGQTALHDALNTAINETTDFIAGLEDHERPSNVIFVTFTDGKENASETPGDVVRELVERRQEDHGWEFLFVGANQDAALTASSMGMKANRSLDMDHSGEGARNAYRSTSERISRARREGSTGEYTDEDRQKQDESGDS
ncbi:VWA domain-containing protein [Natrialbaceae archaeon A-CW2]|uniref:vWA domain-containing protein n=1 Tax=Natronosalvus amylolyticus TaxID=2961994 RepID=UPI0020C9992C|nr:vWA domain-containing protein [Natronosalvus amylolyticus]